MKTWIAIWHYRSIAEICFDAAIHSGAGAGLTFETTILSGQPDEVLGKRVEDHGKSLVAMGAFGHSRIHAFVIGSTTSEMLRGSRAPVVLMR